MGISVDLLMDLSAKYANNMTKDVHDALDGMAPMFEYIVAAGQPHPVVTWLRNKQVHTPGSDLILNGKAPLLGGIIEAEPKRLSVVKKLVEAIKTNPDHWWNYDEIMAHWDAREDPIPHKDRIRTAVYNLKKKGEEGEFIETRDDGRFRAPRGLSPSPARPTGQRPLELDDHAEEVSA